MPVYINHFISEAESGGLPVKVLQLVQKQYTVVKGDPPDRTLDFPRVMSLTQPVIDDLKLASLAPVWDDEIKKYGRNLEGNGVNTFYHESTHAYLFLKEASKNPEVVSALQDATKYYTGAKLSDGSTVTDGFRVSHEAAGEYVGHCALALWTAIDVLRNLVMQRVKDNARQLLADVLATHKTYDNTMSKRVFGYEPRGETNPRVLDREIPPRLKKLCDTAILENAVPHVFLDAPRLRDLWLQLHRPGAPRLDEDKHLARYAIPAREDPSLDGDALFEHGSPKLRPAAEVYLHKWVARLNAAANKRVTITGHADSTGSPKYNLDLSRRRALAVQLWFVGKHVRDAALFIVEGKGDTEPIATNNTPEGRRKNRRVEIRIGR